MHSNDPGYTDPAMAVIRHYDPETYRAIAADDGWNVSTGDSPASEEADATTEALPLPRDKRDTVLDPAEIERDADYIGIPAADYEASVLVHEYKHHIDGYVEEIPAYLESMRFDRRLPSYDQAILRYDQQALRDEETRS